MGKVLGMRRGEVIERRWFRKDDGRRLALTDKGRLLEQLRGANWWQQMRCPCTYHEALIHALANGFTWVAEYPDVQTRPYERIAPRGKVPPPDERCKVRLVRVRVRGEERLIDVVRVDPRRDNSLSPLKRDMRRQPLWWRAQREYRLRCHALRVACDQPTQTTWDCRVVCRVCQRGCANFCADGVCRECRRSGKPISPRERRPCRHCRKKLENRPRGLCWTCYYTPGLRDRYPAGGLA